MVAKMSKKSKLALFFGVFGWLLVFNLPEVHAQTATITVASIPTTVAGSGLYVNWKVTNTGTTSHSFGVGAEIRQGATVLKDLGGETTPSITPNGTSSGSFFYSIPAGWASGSYTARAAVWTGAAGSSTRLNTSDMTFTVDAQTTSATISVASIGTVVAGNVLIITYTVTNTGNYTRAFGVGAEIRQGNTLLASLNGVSTPSIRPNNTWKGSFFYNIPAGWASGSYTARAAVWTGAAGSSTRLNTYNMTFTVDARTTAATVSVTSIGTVVAGNGITISYTVKNTGNYTRTFGVGAEVHHAGSTIPVSSATTGSISPGSTENNSFTFDVPSDWDSGTDTARVVVWSGAAGSSSRLDTYDRPFTVDAKTTSATISVASIATVVAGNEITISYTVKNTGNFARTFGVGGEVHHAGSITSVGDTSTGNLSPGGTFNNSFTFKVPTGWDSGTDTARAAVWSGTPGSSIWLNNNDRPFTVEARVNAATVTVASIGTAVVGDQIVISYTVKNTGNYAKIFHLGAEIDYAGAVAPVGQDSTGEIAVNSTGNGSFRYTIPYGWNSGTDSAHVVVWCTSSKSNGQISGFVKRRFLSNSL